MSKSENKKESHVNSQDKSKSKEVDIQPTTFKNSVSKHKSEDTSVSPTKSKFAIGKFKKGCVSPKTFTNKKVMLEIAFSTPFSYTNKQNDLVTIVTINMVTANGQQQHYFHGDYVATYCSNAVTCLNNDNPEFYDAIINCHYFRTCDKNDKPVETKGKGQNSGTMYNTYVCVFALKTDKKKMTNEYKKEFVTFLVDLFKGFGNFDLVTPDQEDEGMLGSCDQLPTLTYNFLLSVKAVKQDNPTPKFVDLVKNNIVEDFQNRISLETKLNYPVFKFMYSSDVRTTMTHLFGNVADARIIKIVETAKNMKN